ncbi:MAG: septal junction protein FraD [Dolichospermum sp.]
MDSLFKEILGIFEFIKGLFAGVQKFLTPAKAYSWQTFIYLSVFSWGISYFAVGYVKDIIAFCGWLFLLAGTAWYTTDDPLRFPGTFMPVGSIITGFLVSVFAFGHQENILTAKTIVIWPTISAIVTAIPNFFEGTGGRSAKAKLPKLQDRQKIIVLLSWCMLISCWLQFYFVIDKWLKDYPSLRADNFQKSAFVIRLEPPAKKPKNGDLILNKLQPLVNQQIANKPWSEVEKWLIDADEKLENLGNRTINNYLSRSQETQLWTVEHRVVNAKSGGYQLDILTIWNGPSANTKGFYWKKSCFIQPSQSGQQTNKDNKNAVAKIYCDRTSKFFNGSPPPKK